MIFLCTDRNLILSAVNTQNASDYIIEHIRLYLESYGTDYEFQDVFLQKNTDLNIFTAVILRYNTQIYISVSDTADLQELVSFVSGFTKSTVIADKILRPYFSDCEICYEMRKNGEVSAASFSNIKEISDHKKIADLVGESLSQEEKMDFYLNFSHQIRHNKIFAYAYYVNFEPVSAVIVSRAFQNIHIITSVYTQKYFRGNGFARQILEFVCFDLNKKYVLLCEEHNRKFYEKCGFSVADTCIRIRL